MEEFDLIKADILTQSITGGGCENVFFEQQQSFCNGGGGVGACDGGDQLRIVAANLRHRRNSKVSEEAQMRWEERNCVSLEI